MAHRQKKMDVSKDRDSKPAENHADRSPQPAQPSSDDQSGSTGRRAPDGEQPQGIDTGQGRYGQSGFAEVQAETIGQAKYRRSEAQGDPKTKSQSNRGSGRADPAPPAPGKAGKPR